jgi:hypothetical protein
MGNPEQRLISKTLVAMPDNQRLFRINAGTGWVGKMSAGRGPHGSVTLLNARPLHAGPKGWPDLFGWTTVEITPDMVGKKIAVATGYEVKATGDLSVEQSRFRSLLKSMGGIFKTIRR